MVGFKTDGEGYYIYKDPNVSKDYKIDWSEWLNGDAIASVVWTVPTGIVKDGEFNNTTTATVVLSGGTLNKNYLINCHVVTALGNQEDQSFRVVIVNQ
jgi:hypothetical protein